MVDFYKFIIATCCQGCTIHYAGCLVVVKVVRVVQYIIYRDRPIMLIFSPIMLCCSTQNFDLLCSRIRIVLSLLSQFVNKFT